MTVVKSVRWHFYYRISSRKIFLSKSITISCEDGIEKKTFSLFIYWSEIRAPKIFVGMIFHLKNFYHGLQISKRFIHFWDTPLFRLLCTLRRSMIHARTHMYANKSEKIHRHMRTYNNNIDLSNWTELR